MPRDFSKAIVYKICCNDPSVTECYVGSTTDLRQRRVTHKTQCNNDKAIGHNSPVYKFIRDNGGWVNWKIEVLQSYPECASVEELLKYEREHIERLKASLNRYVPGRTQRGWYLDRKEHILERIECEFCGRMSTRGCMPRHQRSQKCLAAQDAEL